MNSDEQYVPSEEQVRVAYMGDRITYDGLSGEEALGEWAAFLARVRRDAWNEGASHAENSAGGYYEEADNPYRATGHETGDRA